MENCRRICWLTNDCGYNPQLKNSEIGHRFDKNTLV